MKARGLEATPKDEWVAGVYESIFKRVPWYLPPVVVVEEGERLVSLTLRDAVVGYKKAQPEGEIPVVVAPQPWSEVVKANQDYLPKALEQLENMNAPEAIREAVRGAVFFTVGSPEDDVEEEEGEGENS